MPKPTKTALKTIERIAREELSLETLQTRNWDSHDFKEQAVWSIKAALLAAYEAGAQQGKASLAK